MKHSDMYPRCNAKHMPTPAQAALGGAALRDRSQSKSASAVPTLPMNARSSASGLVYSTDSGRMCPTCRQPLAGCSCRAAARVPRGDGVLRVGRETKGRAGKGVTLIRGLALEPAALAALGKQLKTACGSGGTVKDGVIEVQGDHVERVMQLLAAQGCPVKRSGG